MKHYYVIEVSNKIFPEPDVIGVADSRENYIKMINDYFGNDLSRKAKESGFNLIEQYGAEADLQVIDQDGYEYYVFISYHQLNKV